MHKDVVVTARSPLKQVDIPLTGSKSESNRALILQAISKGVVNVQNLSDAADTAILTGALQKLARHTSPYPLHINVGHAGTAMRFLTAYVAVTNRSSLIEGSTRMHERPIGLLVDALISLGARIDYVDKEGFPPLEIKGGIYASTARLTIAGNISSQYLSALLLIAPALPGGLVLEITGALTSRPYVAMTVQMLQETGVACTWHENVITVAPKQQFMPCTLFIEPDWSAASYWYSIVGLLPGTRLALPGLKEHSLQGDSIVAQLMTQFGVKTNYDIDGGILLENVSEIIENTVFDLKDCPDLAQTLIVFCAAKGVNAQFTGLETLKIKETNRVLALQTELKKIGVNLIEHNGVYDLATERLSFPDTLRIKTYDDHRMAMAFAPLALKVKTLIIEDYAVVEKSYPDFWKHLQLAGFLVEEINA